MWNIQLGHNLTNHIAWGQACLQVYQQPPNTAAAYVEHLLQLDKDLDPLIGASREDGYMRRWLKRAWLIYVLEAKSLRVAFGTLSVKSFVTCWPDEHRLLLRLLMPEEHRLEDADHVTMAKALKALGYTDKPELLAMHACLVDDVDAQTILRSRGVDWIDRNRKVMLKRLHAWYAKDKMWPHPGVFFPSCRDLE